MTPWLLGPLPVQWPEQTHVLGSMQSTTWPRGGGAITPRADAGARRGRAPPSASAFSSCHSTYGGHLRERSCVPACFRECTACADSYLRTGMERKERGGPWDTSRTVRTVRAFLSRPESPVSVSRTTLSDTREGSMRRRARSPTQGVGPNRARGRDVGSQGPDCLLAIRREEESRRTWEVKIQGRRGKSPHLTFQASWQLRGRRVPTLSTQPLGGGEGGAVVWALAAREWPQLSPAGFALL